ncbi:MAG: helix-turn-helix domain-containing protein [Gammaproteobacteria bacterium]|nr:helix-turn-helix domain-containing protein [Gammaproteobacteria bacterium]
MADGRTDTALSLGERLRSARKARALTLAQAAEALHLEVEVVRALEEERFAVLGAAVFVRGHLKAYAHLLGLSEEAVLAAYRAADPSSDAPPAMAREREKPLRPVPSPLTILVLIGLALLLVLVFWVAGAAEAR